MSILSKVKNIATEYKKGLDSADAVATLKYLEGIPELIEGSTQVVSVSPKDNKLYIGSDKNKQLSLDLNRLIFVEDMTVEEVTSKNKSVVKRAVVGSLLGPVGTLVGGMSGVGKKSKTKDIRVLVIGYKKDGDTKQISFMGGKGMFGYGMVANKLKQLTKDKNVSMEL